MRPGASRASANATSSSTRPAPAAMVSAACASALSLSASAAAMPPCAQADDAPCPSGAAEITVTGRGASFSAQNRPASPPPMMTTSSVLVNWWIELFMLFLRRRLACAGTALIFQIDHALDRSPRSLGNDRIDHDLLAQVEQAFQNVRERDPLHVRAQIARLHHL